SRKLVLVLPARVQLPNPARRFAFDQYPGRAAGVEGRVLGALVASAEWCDERLEVCFDVKEVDRPCLRAPLLIERRAIGGGADAHRLAQAGDSEWTVGCLRIADEHAANLEDADAIELARLVVLQVCH